MQRFFFIFLCRNFKNTRFMKTENSQSDEARFYKELEAEIAEWFNNINVLYDKAYLEYKPIVDNICSRTAHEKEVDGLLTWIFDFVEDERFLTLFKKICHKYNDIYPDVVSFYLNEYKDMYEIEDVDILVDNEDNELPR